MHQRRIATTLLLLTMAHALSAQRTTARGVIDAVVTDTNLVPLAGVEATIAGSTLRVITAANGRFRFVDLPDGQYVLALKRDGFAAISMDVQVSPGDTVRLSLSLQPAPPTSGAAAANAGLLAARRAAFELHRARGHGQFLNEAEITARKTTRIRQLLSGFPSVEIQGSLPTTIDVAARGTYCFMQLFVDGQPFTGPSVDQLPGPDQLLGIEVYERAEVVPAEIPTSRARPCGAILVWTKSAT